MVALWHRSGGPADGPPLLLHGLGATADALAPLIEHAERAWPGPWIAPDLRGHGRSPHARPYGIGAHAVAELLDSRVPAGGDARPLHVVGHSMGGAVALALASGWFGVDVARVVAHAVVLPGLGHHAHAQAPAAVLDLLAQSARARPTEAVTRG